MFSVRKVSQLSHQDNNNTHAKEKISSNIKKHKDKKKRKPNRNSLDIIERINLSDLRMYAPVARIVLKSI